MFSDQTNAAVIEPPEAALQLPGVWATIQTRSWNQKSLGNVLNIQSKKTEAGLILSSFT